MGQQNEPPEKPKTFKTSPERRAYQREYRLKNKESTREHQRNYRRRFIKK